MFAPRKLGFVLGLVLLTNPGLASDLAILRNGFSIRHERRQMVGSVTRLYLATDASAYVDVATDQIDRFEQDLSPPSRLISGENSGRPAPAALPANPQKLNEVINSIGDLQHIDPDLINSVIHAESGFNPRAVSPKGAQGLMQLMPQTASHLGVANAFDPRANVEGGTRYLRELLERYNFDLIKALAAYNAGPQRVEQYRGLPPYLETRAYVARVVRDFNRKKVAERKTSSATRTSGNKIQAGRPHGSAKPAAVPVLGQQTSH
jgi:soluble lytic murein transglycosylase-like protein